MCIRDSATAASSSAQQKTDAPVPNIVVKSFTYGDGKTVAAGAKFPLSFTFENTGSLTCENIVVIVDGGESFTVDGGTNTAHYKSLGAGKEQKQELNMQALPAAKSGAQSISCLLYTSSELLYMIPPHTKRDTP